MKIRLAVILFLSISLILLCYTRKGNAQINNGNENENYNPEEIIVTDPVSLETFQDELSDDGDFISIDNSEIDPDNSDVDESSDVDVDIYFNYIWVPHSRYRYEGWTPYNDGRWVWTDWGWTWVSDYSWGWGPYHYGRWWYSHAYGWVWSPGRVWGPGWVNWRNNSGYVGWYPISPRNHWSNNRFSNTNHHYNENGWVIIRKNDFTNHITKSSEITGNTRNEVLNNSTPYVNINRDGKKIFNSCPDVKEIEKVQNKKIVQKPLNEVTDLHLQKKVITSDPKTKTSDPNTKIKTTDPNPKTTDPKTKTTDPKTKTTEPKSKTDVNNVTNYNTSKTYNSTETYNKTNTTPKENTNKTENNNNNVNTNKTGKTNNTGNTYNPGSSNKTGTSNKTGNTSPKVSQTPKVATPPPVKNTPPPVKNNQSPKKENPPPEKKNK